VIPQANTAILLDGMDVFARPIKVNFARGGGGPGIIRSNDPDRVTRTVHIGGLQMDDLPEDSLAEYFKHIGEVCKLYVSVPLCMHHHGTVNKLSPPFSSI
jgi:RNA recognition motif-containing protein